MEDESLTLAGLRVALVGKLAGMSRREAQQLIRQRGGVAADHLDSSTNLAIIGEAELPVSDGGAEPLLDGAASAAAERGELEVISETQFWERLGLIESGQHVHRLYTPAMLADLIGVPVAVIRRWRRRGLIIPSREVRRLPYFDFQEVATARRLAELLASGVSPQVIEKKLSELAKFLPGVQRPLAQLSVIIEGKHLLLRQNGGLLAPGGQRWFDFDATTAAEADGDSPALTLPARPAEPPCSAEQMLDLAAELEDDERLPGAIEMYRSALAAGGPTAEVCFLLAELLYRTGDLAGARERYFMAVELDENYVEARANLGCVLAELGQRDLALAAFEGALAYHPDYPDAHYHLARTLDELGRPAEAERHWQEFLALAPESPWAAEARDRLGG